VAEDLPFKQTSDQPAPIRRDLIQRRHWHWYLLPSVIAFLLAGGMVFWFSTDYRLIGDLLAVGVLWLMVLLMPRARDYDGGHGLRRLLGWLAVYLVVGFAGIVLYAASRDFTHGHGQGPAETVFVGAEASWTILAFAVVCKLDRRKGCPRPRSL
jgi:hypothetical protein